MNHKAELRRKLENAYFVFVGFALLSVHGVTLPPIANVDWNATGKKLNLEVGLCLKFKFGNKIANKTSLKRLKFFTFQSE